MRVLDFIRSWTWRSFKPALAGIGLALVVMLFMVIADRRDRPRVEVVGSKALPWLPLDLRSLEPDIPRPMRDFFPEDVEAVCAVSAYLFYDVVGEDGARIPLVQAGGTSGLSRVVDLPDPGSLEPRQSKAFARWFLEHYDPDAEGDQYILVLSRNGRVSAVGPSAIMMPKVPETIYVGNEHGPPCVPASGYALLRKSGDRYDFMLFQKNILGSP